MTAQGRFLHQASLINKLEVTGNPRMMTKIVFVYLAIEADTNGFPQILDTFSIIMS